MTKSVCCICGQSCPLTESKSLSTTLPVRSALLMCMVKTGRLSVRMMQELSSDACQRRICLEHYIQAYHHITDGSAGSTVAQFMNSMLLTYSAEFEAMKLGIAVPNKNHWLQFLNESFKIVDEQEKVMEGPVRELLSRIKKYKPRPRHRMEPAAVSQVKTEPMEAPTPPTNLSHVFGPSTSAINCLIAAIESNACTTSSLKIAPPARTIDIKMILESLICAHCKVMFADTTGRSQHFKKMHPDEVVRDYDVAVDGPLSCVDRFSLDKILEIHMCPYCDSVALYRGSLRTHCRHAHPMLPNRQYDQKLDGRFEYDLSPFVTDAIEDPFGKFWVAGMIPFLKMRICPHCLYFFKDVTSCRHHCKRNHPNLPHRLYDPALDGRFDSKTVSMDRVLLYLRGPLCQYCWTIMPSSASRVAHVTRCHPTVLDTRRLYMAEVDGPIPFVQMVYGVHQNEQNAEVVDLEQVSDSPMPEVHKSAFSVAQLFNNVKDEVDVDIDVE